MGLNLTIQNQDLKKKKEFATYSQLKQELKTHPSLREKKQKQNKYAKNLEQFWIQTN